GAVGRIAETQAPIAEADEVLLRQRVQHCLAERSVGQRFCLFKSAHNEREVEQAQLLYDTREGRCRCRKDLLRPAANSGLLLHLVAELRPGEFANLHLAPLFAASTSANF